MTSENGKTSTNGNQATSESADLSTEVRVPSSTLEQALAELSRSAHEPLQTAALAQMPGSSAEAVSAHVNAILGRAVFQVVERSRSVRAELERLEQEIMEDMRTTHASVQRHLENGERLFKIAEFLRAEMSAK